MNVVTNLFSLIAKNLIRSSSDAAVHQVSEKAMQLGSRVIRTGDAPRTETHGLHAKVAPIFLHHGVGSHFRRPENAVHGAVNRHLFRNSPGGELVVLIQLPA